MPLASLKYEKTSHNYEVTFRTPNLIQMRIRLHFDFNPHELNERRLGHRLGVLYGIPMQCPLPGIQTGLKLGQELLLICT